MNVFIYPDLMMNVMLFALHEITLKMNIDASLLLWLRYVQALRVQIHLAIYMLCNVFLQMCLPFGCGLYYYYIHNVLLPSIIIKGIQLCPCFTAIICYILLIKQV